LESAPVFKGLDFLEEDVSVTLRRYIQRQVVREGQVIEVGGALDPVMRARTIKEAEQSVDEEDEQEGGERRALGSARVHKDTRRCVLPHADFHTSLVVEVLEELDIRYPELLQDSPQARVPGRVEGVAVVKVDSDERAVSRFGQL